jgi:glycosyltransferase involved in cell wall biosynthesis
MLAILATHPVQYQIPLWQLLAKDGKVPFEVWYLTRHGTDRSLDREFGREFAWDLNTLEGYPHRFLRISAGASPNTPLRCRISESLPNLFRETKTRAILVMGWQVAAYWQAVWAAHRAGVQVWLRGESNIMRKQEARSWELGAWKQRAKHLALSALFKRVDHFLCVGTANRELYRSYGVSESKLHMAMYAVDNERFARQANEIRNKKLEIRKQWGVPEDAFCVLFCGKFIPKKRPMDLVEAARLLLSPSSKPQAPNSRPLKIHLLFAGSGELGAELRANCNVMFDAESPDNREPITDNVQSSATINREPITDNPKPPASFAGFLNQTAVSNAYVAADALVLPSDYTETWGLVVNEAMASRLRCIISDRCGCAPDLGGYQGNRVFRFGHIEDLAQTIVEIAGKYETAAMPPSLLPTAELVSRLYAQLKHSAVSIG